MGVKVWRDLVSTFKFHFLQVFAFEHCRMASNGNNPSWLILEFSGEDYEYWSIKMKTFGKVDPSMKETWLLDSGASKHMMGKDELFAHIDDSFKTKIRIGDNSTLQVEGMGTMEVPTKEGMKKVNHVYFIPKLQHNLLSIRQIMENNYKLVFDDGKCVIYDKNRGNKVVTIVPMSENKLFPLKFGSQRAALANVSIENKGWLWHLRYGHLNHSSLRLDISSNGTWAAKGG